MMNLKRGVAPEGTGQKIDHNRWQLRHESRSPPETTNVRSVFNRIISDVDGFILAVDPSLASIHLVPGDSG